MDYRLELRTRYRGADDDPRHAARKALEEQEEEEGDDELVDEKILNMNEDDGESFL